MAWIEEALPHSTETVWNTGLVGTSVANHGDSLTIGREGGWAPEDLVLLAAESCFMSTLLELAREASIDVLGYVSKAHLETKTPRGRGPSIVLMPCVVVGTPDDIARVHRLATRVPRESIVAKLLNAHLQVTLDVRAVQPQ
jgi:organic hydroperoxide reductase OsmC/OhrA